MLSDCLSGMVGMPFFESERKVQVFGSSLALTLPAMFVKAHEIEKGLEVNVLYDLDGVLLFCLEDDPNEVVKRISGILKKMERKLEEKGTNK